MTLLTLSNFPEEEGFPALLLSLDVVELQTDSWRVTDLGEEPEIISAAKLLSKFPFAMVFSYNEDSKISITYNHYKRQTAKISHNLHYTFFNTLSEVLSQSTFSDERFWG